MIKLKNILSEGYAWERTAGEPLPTMKTVQEKYQRNLQEQPGNEIDIVTGNPGKEVPVKTNELQIYDVNGDLMPKQYVPAGLEKRIQTTPDVQLHTKYYFATRPGKMDGTGLVVYDRVTGQLRDNDTKELLVTLQKDMPAREIYLWLRRNHLGKRNVKFEAYDAKGVEDAADEANEEAKPDYIDLDKDGDKEESMKKAAADKEAEEVNEEETEEEADHAADEAGEDLDALNMGSLKEGFWSRVKGNLHGHEYILRETFKK
jgi:hypothetical protein